MKLRVPAEPDRRRVSMGVLGMALLAIFPGSVLAAIPVGAPVPPPVAQSTADCARPVYASDHLVCADPELRMLDAELAALLADGGAGTVVSGFAWEEAEPWFRRRGRCAFEADHRRCLKEAYTDRLATVRSASLARPIGSVVKARCDGAWRGIGIVLETDPRTGHLAIRDTRSRRVLGVSAPESGYETWRPFSTYARRDDRLVITIGSTEKIACKLRSRGE